MLSYASLNPLSSTSLQESWPVVLSQPILHGLCLTPHGHSMIAFLPSTPMCFPVAAGAGNAMDPLNAQACARQFHEMKQSIVINIKQWPAQ